MKLLSKDCFTLSLCFAASPPEVSSLWAPHFLWVEGFEVLIWRNVDYEGLVCCGCRRAESERVAHAEDVRHVVALVRGGQRSAKQQSASSNSTQGYSILGLFVWILTSVLSLNSDDFAPGTAARPEGVLATSETRGQAQEPAGGAMEVATAQSEPPPASAAPAEPLPTSISSTSSLGSSSTVTAPPPSTSSSMESATSSSLLSSPDAEQRSQDEVTPTPSATPTPSREAALSGEDDAVD